MSLIYYYEVRNVATDALYVYSINKVGNNTIILIFFLKKNNQG